MNVHDSERMAGLLETSGYDRADSGRRRRPGRHQHLQRARARGGQALHAARRDQGNGSRARPRSDRRRHRLRRAAGRRQADQAVRRRRRHRRRDAAGQDAADAGGRGAGRSGDRLRRPHAARTGRDRQSVRGAVVSARRRPPRRSGPRLRDDHRRLQRLLRVLRGARTRAATSACGRRRRSSPTCARRRRAAAGKCSCSARSSITTRRRTIRRAISRRCSKRSTKFPASIGSALRARIRAIPAIALIAAVRDLPEGL